MVPNLNSLLATGDSESFKLFCLLPLKLNVKELAILMSIAYKKEQISVCRNLQQCLAFFIQFRKRRAVLSWTLAVNSQNLKIVEALKSYCLLLFTHLT